MFLSLIASIVISSCLLLFINFIKTKSKNKKDVKANENQVAENYALNFQLYSEAQKLKTIAQFIPNEYEYIITYFIIFFKFFKNVLLFMYKPVYSS